MRGYLRVLLLLACVGSITIATASGASATVISYVTSSAQTGVVNYEPTTTPSANQVDQLIGWEIEAGRVVLRDRRGRDVHAIDEASTSDALCASTTALDHVTCPVAQMKLLNVNLGPGDDSAVFSSTRLGGSFINQLPVQINAELGTGSDVTIGGAGNDTFHGGEGYDWIYGADGDDTIQGGPQVDVIRGENGNDSVDYSDTSASVTVNLLTRDTEIPFFGDTSRIPCSGNREIDGCEFAITEGAIGTRFADTLNGNSEANTLEGRAGEDTLDGRTGDDTFNAQDGEKDRIVCGDGNDTANVDKVDQLDGCETVNYPAEPQTNVASTSNGSGSVGSQTTSTSVTGGSTAAKSILKVKSAKLKGKKISVTVSCISGTCKGMLRLVSAEKSELIPMLYKSIGLKSGQNKTVVFSVTKGQLKKLKRKKKLKLAISARITDDATDKPATFARTLSIKTRSKK